jgi:hypothetical protein
MNKNNQYIEVVFARDRKGRTVSALNMPVSSEDLKNGSIHTTKAYGRVVVLNFNTMVAEFWYPGSPSDRRRAPITLRDVDTPEK